MQFSVRHKQLCHYTYTCLYGDTTYTDSTALSLRKLAYLPQVLHLHLQLCQFVCTAVVRFGDCLPEIQQQVLVCEGHSQLTGVHGTQHCTTVEEREPCRILMCVIYKLKKFIQTLLRYCHGCTVRRIYFCETIAHLCLHVAMHPATCLQKVLQLAS